MVVQWMRLLVFWFFGYEKAKGWLNGQVCPDVCSTNIVINESEGVVRFNNILKLI